MGKGEIARYEQFLLFPQCFQKACTADTKKTGFVWERVNRIENISGKGENASYQHSFFQNIFKMLIVGILCLFMQTGQLLITDRVL